MTMNFCKPIVDKNDHDDDDDDLDVFVFGCEIIDLADHRHRELLDKNLGLVDGLDLRDFDADSDVGFDVNHLAVEFLNLGVLDDNKGGLVDAEFLDIPFSRLT